jgi:hypothetical protein
MPTVGGHHIFALPTGFDTVQLHDPSSSFFANQHAISTQYLPDARLAILAFAVGMGSLDVNQ